jgi:S1-C subfamily serine protease
MRNPRSIFPVALVSAVLGGGVVVGLAAVFGLGSDAASTTVVQQSPLATADASQNGGALTARDIYKRDAPGVAFVTAQIVQPSSGPFGATQQGTSTGSGFVLDTAGTIATNAHVVDGATKVTVRFADNASVPARILGVDKSTDLALLRVDPKKAGLHPLALGSSRNIQVGDPTIAIGNPFGLDRTLTTGVVSALQRQIKAPNGFTIDNVIQTDAAINPGNSGGPLLDATGRVIGINSQIETGSSGGGNVGIGFAIPIDTVKQKLAQLKTAGTVKYAYLGVTAAPIDAAMKKALSLPVGNGALVQSVLAGGPAAKAGIRAGDVSAQVGGNNLILGGDILTKVDGQSITGPGGLQAIIGRHKVGDKVKVDLLRSGKPMTVTVALGNRPASVSASGQGGSQLP